MATPDPEKEISGTHYRQTFGNEPATVLHGQFQKFVTSEQFHENYEIDPKLLEKLKTDQLEVVKFGAEFMRHVLFGEETVKQKEGAWDKRNERMKERATELKAAAEMQAEHAAETAMAAKKDNKDK